MVLNYFRVFRSNATFNAMVMLPKPPERDLPTATPIKFNPLACDCRPG
jgi:hypothetical protein